MTGGFVRRKPADVAPANCLPWLLRAMEEGYLVDAGQETLEGLDCLRLAPDTTAPGGKVLCTVWLGGDGPRCMPSFLRTAAWC